MKKESSKSTIKEQWVHFRQSRAFLFVRIALLIVLILFVATSLFEFRYLVLDDLSISITPVQSRIITNTTPTLAFAVKTNTFSFCTSECSFTLTDTFTQGQHTTHQTLSPGINTPWSYEVTNTMSGYQERLYTFEVMCKNTNTFLCKESTPRYRSALVSVTKEYNEEELSAKNLAEQLINTTTTRLQVERHQEEYYNELLSRIEEVSQHNYSRKNNLDDLYEEHVVNTNHYSLQQFADVKELFVPSITDEVTNLMLNIELFNKNTDLLRTLYNQTYHDHYSFFARTNDQRAHELYEAYETLSNLNTSRFVEFHQANINSTYQTTQLLVEDADEEKETYEQAYQERLDAQATLFVNFSQSNDLCSDAQSLHKLTEEHNHAVLMTPPELEPYVSFVKEHIFIVSRNDTHLIAGNKSLLNTPGLSLTNYFYYISIPIIPINYCLAPPPLPPKPTITDQIVIPTWTEPQSTPFIIAAPAKKCCLHNECSACKQAPPPVIFIHGHSFNKDNPAESSIQTFSWVQQALAHNKVIINGGDIDYSTRTQGVLSHMPLPLGLRGTYYTLSYYEGETLSTRTRKEEGIEVYSIRLKELIDVALEQTGSQEVVLVAHSMGGLVVHNYLMLFGEDRVHKVVQIATPNTGVSGRAERLCSSFGEAKACDDLTRDSVFLRRLERYEPSTPYYQILGRGCDTDGEDGDGIVALERNTLSYSQEVVVIDGSCDDFLGSSLHNDLLKPDKYPQVVEVLARILTS